MGDGNVWRVEFAVGFDSEREVGIEYITSGFNIRLETLSF